MWQPIETAPRNQPFLAVLNCAGEQTICTMRWPVAEAKNSRPDSKTFHVERVTHWMPLPDLPSAQAQTAPSFADAYQGAMEEVAIWKKRTLEAEELNRKFIAEINGHTHTGEPVQNVASVPDDNIRGLIRLLKRASGHLRWLKKDAYQWRNLNPKTMRAAELLHRDIDAMLAAAPEESK